MRKCSKSYALGSATYVKALPSECGEIESWVSSDREGMRPEQRVPAFPKNENGFSY